MSTTHDGIVIKVDEHVALTLQTHEIAAVDMTTVQPGGFLSGTTLKLRFPKGIPYGATGCVVKVVGFQVIGHRYYQFVIPTAIPYR